MPYGKVSNTTRACKDKDQTLEGEHRFATSRRIIRFGVVEEYFIQIHRNFLHGEKLRPDLKKYVTGSCPSSSKDSRTLSSYDSYLIRHLSKISRTIITWSCSVRQRQVFSMTEIFPVSYTVDSPSNLRYPFRARDIR